MLNSTRNVLILTTFYNGKLTIRHHIGLAVVSKDDVTKHFIARNKRSNRTTGIRLKNTCTHLTPIGRYLVTVVHKPCFPIRSIYQAESSPSHRFGHHYGICAILTYHLVHDIRVGIGQIKSVEILLFFRNAQMQFVGIIEKQDSSQKGTLSHSLRTNEMHIAVHPDFGIRNMRTIQEYDFIQISHRLYPPIS